jgi:general secretion pathway protein D
VVTRDGSTAIIQVGEEQMISKSFEANNQNSNPFLESPDLEAELMGVYMEVTPELRDGGLIDLEIHPVIKEIVGYDTYTVKAATSAGDPDDASPELTGTVPQIRLREIETRVTVEDGSTVGMGGLIYDKTETYSDKVPVLGSIPYLGRLFRSEGSSITKRNLMIFVTATEVDVNGRKASELALNK